MSINKDELLKIENAISGIFKRGARRKIAIALRGLEREMKDAMLVSGKYYEAKLHELLIRMQTERHKTLNRGASSYGDARWAAAAACESWLISLLKDNYDDQETVESIV